MQIMDAMGYMVVDHLKNLVEPIERRLHGKNVTEHL